MLAAAGLTVVVRGGPGPEDYSTYAWKDGQIAIAHIGRAPECADLIYSYRPFSELPEIVATAKMLGAKTV
jgi:hypothetical protein